MAGLIGTALLLAVSMAVVPATTAAAAQWGISKQESSAGPYEPGQEVVWMVTVSCSDPNNDPCTNAVLADALPDGLELVGATIQSDPGGGEITADTDTDTVTYTNPSVPNGSQVQIVITARVDPDLPYDQSGEPITNTATVNADNAEEMSDSDDIIPLVELQLGSETTKTIEPEGALAEPGAGATMTLGSTNTSNDAVDELVIQDPVDPSATPNPFDYLDYAGSGDIVLPPNADTVVEEYWDGDSWEPLDDSVDPGAVQGVRYTFSGDIQPGATASVPVNVVQAPEVEELTEPTTVDNQVASHVVHGDEESSPTTADDTYVITPPDTSVEASKSFDPATVSAGDPTTVTVGATNTGTPVSSMTITEPASGTDNPFEGDDPLTFTGFGPDGTGTGIQWPANADSASVTFTCAEGPTPTLDSTTPDTLPNPPAECTVVGFEVEFTGEIVTGAEASIPFTADTDPDQQLDDVTHANEVAANVPSADEATASDDLVTLADRLATNTNKIISPSEIPSVPGQGVVVQLPSQLLPFGPDGSTTNADQVIIQDPADPANPGDFWDNFTATSVRTTDVPGGSTLTVNYWDGDSWEPVPDCGPFTGPATVSCDLPDGAEGVQFVYDSTADGFPPGTQFQPNFGAAYDGPPNQDGSVENCGASSASSETVAPTDLAEGCDTVDLFPVDGSGDLNFIGKDFLGDDPVSVLARSDDQVTAQITWSTNGFSGVDPMVISDIADPAATDIADSFYDAFNLVRIEPIDESVDPLMQYDQIESVELFIGGSWVEAAEDPCPCDGSFPGYTLTADEQESATSVRLVYTESPSRTTDDPLAPQPGDGVARSTQADGRHLDLTFQVRDYRRSDGSPALGSTNGTIYNVPGDPGLVNDTVRGTGTFEGQEYTDTDDDDVLIIDQPLNVSVAKDWTGGPISVPPSDTPEEFYPTTNVTITGTNESAAKVDQLRLVEPGVPDNGDAQTADGTKPFDAFTLTAIQITPPEGAETTTVTLTYNDGTTDTFTEEEAESLTAADLAEVVGVEVAFDGLIAAGASGSLELTLKLRENDRYTDDPITVADYDPVPDGATATIDDPGGVSGDDTRLAHDDATMNLQDAAIDLNVGKAFDPDQIVEPESGPVTMTISGKPLGPSRTVEMVLTDDEPRFWNQYDFVGFDDATLTAPIEQVQVDAFVDGTFAESGDNVEVTGGDWVTGTPSDTFALPSGVSPGDVQGLRFTFTRADGSIWENPATPTQEVPMLVERRDEIRSGGPVLTDLEANPPAPGETEPGVASNEVDGTVTGADLVTDPDTGVLVPVSADDSAASEIVYVHATNGVEIVKEFDGVVSGGTEPPAAVFPMTITVTNTGNRPIFDVVVSDDPMPADADGPQLILADVDDPFSYEVAGDPPEPPNGDPLPTDPAEVTVEQAGDIESLEFSFPDGAVLEVGQTYTITVMVRFRVGLEAETRVENTVGVTGDRPWDECETRLNDDTGACEADADVTPIPAAVLSQSKFVKATDDDELDVIVDPEAADPDVECAPDADGFYSYPCTPVIAPGHHETWRVRVDNVGNLPLDKLVLYDRLPTPGDTGSYASSARGSEWEPILNNDPPPELVNAPPGAQGIFYYTTAQDYCMDDIEDPMDEPICPEGDPEAGWERLSEISSRDAYREITALKLVIEFDDDNLFQPGEFLAVQGTTTTPAEVPEAGDRSIAWNSAAASGVAMSGENEINLLPTEGTKVGVATASGPLEVTKEVTGEGAEYAPDSFDLSVQCTSAVGTWVETELDPIPVTVTPGEPVIVPNLPYGAECTITEDPDGGQTSLAVTPETVTIGEEPEVTEITAINEYDLTGLRLSKIVDSEATNETGAPIAYGPFEVAVECTFLGEPVYADGYGLFTPMVVTLQDGADPVELTGLPVGSECTITETDTDGAPETKIVVTQDGEDPIETEGTSVTVVLPPGAGDSEISTVVEVTNHFDVGVIDLIKVVDGDGAGIYGSGPFRLEVECTFGDADGDSHVVYSSIVVLGGAAPFNAEIPNIPVGAECTVTEIDDAGATSSVVEPDTVTVGGDEPVEITATNTFDVGSIVVDKVVEGDGAELYGGGPFEVTLECTFDGGEIAIPGGATRELDPGEPVTYDDLPVGAECLVTESVTGGATTVTISSVDDGGPGEVAIADGDAAEVTVTNTFDVGSIVVDKVVDGDGAELYGSGPFEVVLNCTQEIDGETESVEIPDSAVRELVPGEPVIYENLPVDAECVVTETSTGGATTVTISSVDDGAPGAVTIGDSEPANVAVTNVFDVGDIWVEKSLAGPGAAEHEGDVYTVSLECTREVDGADTPVDIPGGATRELSADNGWVAAYERLPQGAVCVVAETAAGGADGVEIVVDGASTSTDPAAEQPQSPEFQVPVGDQAAVDVEVINTWPASEGSADESDDERSESFPKTGSDALLLFGIVLILITAGASLVAIRSRASVT